MIGISAFDVAVTAHAAGTLHAAAAAQRKRRSAAATDASVNRGST